MLLSSTIGRWADRYSSRLRTLRSIIFLQRTCICFACIGWAFLISEQLDNGDITRHDRTRDLSDESGEDNSWKKTVMMIGLVVLEMIERLFAVGNTLMMKRDWIQASFLSSLGQGYSVTLSQMSTLVTPTSKPQLHVLNAVMKRIDLTSKLVALIFISLIVITIKSLVALTLIVAAMNVILLLSEWLCAKWVWNACAKLQESRQPLSPPTFVEEEEGENSELLSLKSKERWINSFKIYFNNNAWKRMIFSSIALNLIAKINSFTLVSTSVLFCAFVVNIDDDLSAKYALQVIFNNRSPIVQLYYRTLLYHYHAFCRLLHVKIQ